MVGNTNNKYHRLTDFLVKPNLTYPNNQELADMNNLIHKTEDFEDNTPDQLDHDNQ